MKERRIGKRDSRSCFPQPGDRRKLARFFVVFMLITLFQESEPVAALTGLDDRWRAMARDGRKAFHERRYADAIAAYARARGAVPGSHCFDDVRLDMKLDQAEVYRFWGAMENLPAHLNTCQRLLSEVERDMGKAAKLDPTIVARYWRRKSDLLWSQNQEQAAAQAYEKVLGTLGSLFSRESEHFIVDAEGMVALLCKHKNYRTMLKFFADFESLVPHCDSADRLVEGTYRKYFDKVKDEIRVSISSGNVEYASELVKGLQQVDRKKAGLGRLWLALVRTAIQSDHANLLSRSKAPLVALSKFYKMQSAQEAYSECLTALDLIRSVSTR